MPLFNISTCNGLWFETFSGDDLAERGPQETSSVVVETVHKISKAHKGGAGVVLPHFKSNATLVTSKGMGLKKAYLGKQNLFSISASDAGMSYCIYYEACSVSDVFKYTHWDQ